VTFCLLPDGEPGGGLLDSALAARGIGAGWATWDDPDVDWSTADLLAVRSAWDYHRRSTDFLDWARTVERDTVLLNGAESFAWNADKAYLTDLDDLPVVPTRLLDDDDLVAGLRAAIDRFGTVVVKPRTGASGLGVVIVGSTSDARLQGLMAGPWVVQPLVETVRTVGEASVYVFDGRATSQVDKLPGGEEIRVHELYGGGSRVGVLSVEAAALAQRAMAVASERVGVDLAYGRVDMMRHQGRLVVSEIELIEPGLYLGVIPDNAEPLAELVAERLARG